MSLQLSLAINAGGNLTETLTNSSADIALADFSFPTRIEAGGVSMVELLKLLDQRKLLASLYNEAGDFVKHRKVDLYRHGNLQFGIKNAPTYYVDRDVYLYMLEREVVGVVLSVID